jgi:hypothetical protein
VAYDIAAKSKRTKTILGNLQEKTSG